MALKRIAVIGSGVCGLTTLKSLSEEGLEAVCLERSSHIGGLWRYHEEDVDGMASVTKTTVINTSKELIAFSDFPPRDDVPNYMKHDLVYDYIASYAARFDLIRYVQFNKEVIKVEEAVDYEATGRLMIKVRDTETGRVATSVFDGVVVCVGHHVYPNLPKFPGMELFQGKVVHSHSLKGVQEFQDQIVVVVGMGNSGMDAAVDISSAAKQVYLSSRRGAWIMPRVGPSGLPFDLSFLTRWFDLLARLTPFAVRCWAFEKVVDRRFDHALLGLKPKHRIMSQRATVNDILPVKILCGEVKIRKNVKQFTAAGVVFEGQDDVTPCNAIVLATGYRIQFPFLAERLTAVRDNIVHLYKYVYPPRMRHPTLAVVGLLQPNGAGFPLAEAQARWAALVFSGKLSLPDREFMEADILKKELANLERYTLSPRHTIQVDYIPYLDEIYSLVGAKPNLERMIWADPVLFRKLFFGPSVPYQYRLQGPHAWTGAREAVMECERRVTAPLQKNHKSEWIVSRKLFLLFVIVAVLLSWVFNLCT